MVDRLGAIVDGWDEKAGAPAVERHIAASLLAELYEAVKFDTALATTSIATPEEDVEKAEMAAPVEVAEESANEDDTSTVIDLSDIFGFSSDDDEEVEEESPAVISEEKSAEEVVEDKEQPEEIVEQIEEIVEQPEMEVALPEEIAEEVVEQPAEPAVDEEPAVEAEPSIEEPSEIIEQPAEQPIEQSAEQPIESAAEQSPAPSVEETEAKSAPQTSLFDMDMVRRPRSANSRRVIMSLYGESPARRDKSEKRSVKESQPAPEKEATPQTVAPQSEPIQNAPIEESPVQNEPIQNDAPQSEPIAEEPVVLAVSAAERIAAAQTEGQTTQVLGEVIGAGTTTLADAVAASQPQVQTVQNDRVGSLRSSIGINDRFILIRDLFGGDGEAYDKAIDEIDAFDDFNECLVHIATEYRWNPNSDGARMIMDLITRKLL